MAENFPGLIQKGKMFHFRLAIPRKFWDIAKCREISCSLDTNNYQEAVFKWKTEFTHLQKFMNVFEEIIMKINADGKLVLDAPDVDKVLLYRLGKIQHFLEENVTEIERGDKGLDNIQLYDPKDKNTDKVRDLMANVIISYLRDLVETNQANITLRTTYSKLKAKEIELGLNEKNSDEEEWFKSFCGHMHSLEKYTVQSVKHIKEDTSYKPSNPKVLSLLQTYDAVKSVERITTPMTRTPWKKFFKRFVENKKNRKGTCDLRIRRNEMSVQLFFLLLNKEYVEEITKLECRKFCELVYQVPKNWHRIVSCSADLHKILTKNPKKVVGKKNIKDHMISIKEFLRFAAREDIIPTSLNEFFDPPLNSDPLERASFTSNELRKIFNPETYPDSHNRKHIVRFWVPLIALYQGCRLSEICQLDTDDIISYKKVPCFSINPDGDDKAVKTKGSKRIIPIHPQLIEMGFLSYVEYRSKEHRKKLFSDKVSNKPGMYRRGVSEWFARYIDGLGIDDPSKVFHSFRHTFTTKAIEKKVPSEYQNALGGWVDNGIGQRVYGKEKNINVMLEELSKVTYPIHKELKELATRFRTSYVINILQR